MPRVFYPRCYECVHIREMETRKEKKGQHWDFSGVKHIDYNEYECYCSVPKKRHKDFTLQQTYLRRTCGFFESIYSIKGQPYKFGVSARPKASYTWSANKERR